MSQESRTVRPFVGLSDLENLLGDVKLRFGPTICNAGSNAHVDIQAHEFLLRPVVVDFASDEASMSELRQDLVGRVEGAGLLLHDLALVVVATSSFLRAADIVYSCVGEELRQLPTSVVLTAPSRADAFSAPETGFSVDAYLVLSRTLPLEPLRPHRKGTWIARAHFGVETSLAPAILPPTPLTTEVRLRLGLPARTMRYIDFGDHDLLQPHRDQDQPVLYVDDTILAQLNARRTASASHAFQVQLVHDFVSSVVWRASKSEDLPSVTYEDIRTSLVGSVVRIAAGPGAPENARSRMLRSVYENPERVIAAVEHSIDLLAAYTDAVKDGG